MNPLCRLGFLSFFSLEVRFCPCYNAFGDIHYFRLSSERFWQVPKGGENSKSGDGATRPWVRIPPPPPAAQRHLPLGCSISINTAKSPGDAVLITREGLVRIRNATVLVLFVLVPGFAHRRSGIPPPPPSPNPHETQCSCGFSRFWGCFSCSNLRPRYRFLFAVFSRFRRELARELRRELLNAGNRCHAWVFWASAHPAPAQNRFKNGRFFCIFGYRHFTLAF